MLNVYALRPNTKVLLLVDNLDPINGYGYWTHANLRATLKACYSL